MAEEMAAQPEILTRIVRRFEEHRRSVAANREAPISSRSGADFPTWLRRLQPVAQAATRWHRRADSRRCRRPGRDRARPAARVLLARAQVIDPDFRGALEGHANRVTGRTKTRAGRRSALGHDARPLARSARGSTFGSRARRHLQRRARARRPLRRR